MGTRHFCGNKLEQIIDPETDSLRFYYLGSNYKTKVKHVGANRPLTLWNR